MIVYDKKYDTIVKDIINNKSFRRLVNIHHHGISRYEHLQKISYYSYKLAVKLNMDYESVARGALLHDFYLDGDERSDRQKFLDTFTHPARALKTSKEHFNLNKLEENIIISHMFPIYPSIPKYKESILVNAVDKVIGFKEMFQTERYRFKVGINYLMVLAFIYLNK